MLELTSTFHSSTALLQVGKDLTEGYWQPGNSEPFLGLVEKLTGSPLSADAWVASLKRSTAQVVSHRGRVTMRCDHSV